MRRLRRQAILGLLSPLVCSALLATTVYAAMVGPLSTASGPTPFAPGCNGTPQTGINYLNAEVEPRIAVNPTNPNNLIGVWQQDRWSNGGSNSLLAGVSFDGGATWTQVIIPKITRCSGGSDYERASDPWVSFSPNGTAYFHSLSFNDSNTTSAVLVNKSINGGLTWGDPITLIRNTEPTLFNDKESITADPTNSNYVYAVWDRLEFPSGKASATAAEHAVGYKGPTFFARTTDGGLTWEPAREIYRPPAINQTIGNQIVVLPNGTLVLAFDLIYNNKNAHGLRGTNVAVLISTDKGATWSAKPIIVSQLQSVGVVDPDTGAAVRTGDIIPDVSVDPVSGMVYIVWQDSRFNGGQHDDVVFAKSTDGGQTWSAPVRISQVPGVASFTPTVKVAPNGTVGVTYYDFRNNTPDPSTLPTDYWFVSSSNGGAT